MSTSNPILKSIRESSGLRLSVLFGSFFVFLLIASIFSSVLDHLPLDLHSRLLLSSTIQCILAFCMPAFILARFSSNKSYKWLHLKKAPSLKAIVGVIIVYMISMPAMEWLIEWNSNIHLPASLSSLEEVLRNWEKSAEETTQVLLNTHGILSVIGGILIIGILTGFSEELFFRGGLQGILSRSALGKNMAVWLSAIIFSAMHFEFFGFVPRLLMGAFFGYLLIWTGSLWVPVFAHALNNSMVVITSAITEGDSTSLIDSYNLPLDSGSSILVIASFIMTILFFVGCRDILFKTSKKTIWQKSQPPVSEI